MSTISSSHTPILSSLDRDTLTPLVRQALKRETVEIMTWDGQPLSGGLGSYEGVIGVYRIWGAAQDQGQAVAWSLILQVWSDTAGSTEPTAADYWQREALAYQSGLLSQLPGELTAPHCFGVTAPSLRRAGHEELWIWLEDIQDDTGPTWPSHLIALAAQGLGQFNGGYLQAKSLPAYAWLSQGRTREWLARGAPALAQLHRYQAIPAVQAWLVDDSAVRLLALWAERERYLAALDRLPHTLCHHDAFRRNLLAQRHPHGGYRIVAIDWSLLGTGAIGEEIATLVAVSLRLFGIKAEHIKEFATTVWEAYLAGLTDVGWRGDLRLVRLGYAATAALLYGVGSVGLWLPSMADPMLVEQILGHSIEEVTHQWAQVQGYLLDLGEEARDLLHLS